MDWDDAPSALDEELHEEAGGGEGVFAGGKNPGRDHGGGDEGGEEHGAATAEPLGGVADDGTADAGAYFLFLRQLSFKRLEGRDLAIQIEARVAGAFVKPLDCNMKDV